MRGQVDATDAEPGRGRSGPEQRDILVAAAEYAGRRDASPAREHRRVDVVEVDRVLGLCKAMAGAGPVGAKKLAARVGCAERYVREWLNARAAGDYVVCHAASDSDELAPEQAMVLADDESPVYIPHAWQVPASTGFDEPKALEAFRTGNGILWGDHDGRLFCGVAALYRNAYRGSLVLQWLPALDGVVERLREGIDVADVGCGHGHSTILMAQVFPRSRFRGFDVHEASIADARRAAAEIDLGSRVRFDVARAADYPGRYGLVCFFDCLHDLGDPIAAARHAAEVLAPGGTVMLVESFANDRVEDNLSPVARLASVFREAGFTHFRRAAETPFSLVLEARRRPCAARGVDGAPWPAAATTAGRRMLSRRMPTGVLGRAASARSVRTAAGAGTAPSRRSDVRLRVMAALAQRTCV